MNKKDSILNSGLLEQYVLGLLSPEEIRLVQQHLVDYPELRQHVQGMEQAMEQVLEENAIAPPPALKTAILSEIDDLKTPSLAPKFQRSSRTSLPILTALATTLAILFAFGTYHFHQKSKYNTSSYKILQQKYEDLQADCAQQQAKNEKTQQQYQFVKDPNTQHIHLRGTELAPEALVIAYLNKDKADVALDIVNLPVAPKGKCYHLWADVKGEMIHMGDFKTTNDLQAMKFIVNAESLNVTLEVEGKVEHPTVSQLMVNGAV